MVFNNTFVFLLIFIAITFVMYKTASGDSKIIENFLGLSGPSGGIKLNTIDAKGCGNSSQRQKQLYYNTNQLVNTSIMNHRTKSALMQSLSPMSEASLNSNSSTNQEASSYNMTIGEPYTSPQNHNFPVYTVPGTYQSDLSPRFNPNGLNSYVKYNPPLEKNMASYPNDPLTVNQENYEPIELANMVEKPVIREEFNTCKNASAEEYNNMNKQLTDMGSEAHNQLPIQPMNGGSPSEEPIYYNADRYVFALQKSRLYGRGDFIRGDIPIIPILPNPDKHSGHWFRPSVNLRHDLNAGALSVIGGLNNITVQQLQELMGRDAGGAGKINNGVEVQIANTPTANIQNNLNNTLQQKALNLNMGNQAQQFIDNNSPQNLTQTLAFP